MGPSWRVRSPQFVGQFQHLTGFQRNFTRLSRRARTPICDGAFTAGNRAGTHDGGDHEILDKAASFGRSAWQRSSSLTTFGARANVIVDWNAKAEADRGQEEDAAAAERARHGDHAYRHVRSRECGRTSVCAVPAQSDRCAKRVEGGGRCGRGARRAGGAASRRAGGRSMRRSWLRSADMPEGDAKAAGVALGKKAAAEIACPARQGRSVRAGILSSVHRRRRLCSDRDPGQLDLWSRHALGDELRFAIPSGAAAGPELRDLGEGRQRDPRRMAAAPTPSAARSRPISAGSGSSPARRPGIRLRVSS